VINNFSISNLVAPYVFNGETALSVPIHIARSTLFSIQASITFCDPCTLVFIASNGLYSTFGTCFNAAA